MSETGYNPALPRSPLAQPGEDFSGGLIQPGRLDAVGDGKLSSPGVIPPRMPKDPLSVFAILPHHSEVRRFASERFGRPAAPLRMRAYNPLDDIPKDFMSLVEAHFYHNTPLGSLFASQIADRIVGSAQPFDPEVELGLTGTLPDITHSMPYKVRQQLLDAESRTEFENILARFYAEQRDRMTQGRHGFLKNLAAGLLVAPADPITYIPIGGSFFRGFKLAAKEAAIKGAAKVIGGRQLISNVALGASEGFIAGTGGAALAEFFVQPTQVSRTSDESTMNIAVSGLFGSGIGGAGRFLGDFKKTAIVQDVMKEARASWRKTPLANKRSPDAVPKESAVFNPESASAAILDVANRNPTLFVKTEALAALDKAVASSTELRAQLKDFGNMTVPQLTKLLQALDVPGRTRAKTRKAKIEMISKHQNKALAAIDQNIAKLKNEAQSKHGVSDLATVIDQILDLDGETSARIGITSEMELVARQLLAFLKSGEERNIHVVHVNDLEAGMTFKLGEKGFEVDVIDGGQRVLVELDKPRALGASTDKIIYGTIDETVTTPRTGADGKPYYPMAFRRRSDGRIFIDADRVLASYADKPWTKPKRKGVDPLPEDTFSKPEDWLLFVVEHEEAHGRSPRRPNEPMAAYENRVNGIAMKRYRNALETRGEMYVEGGGLKKIMIDKNTLDWRRGRQYNDAGDAVTVQIDGPKWLTRLGGIASPLVRTMDATSKIARSIAEKMFDSPVHLAQQRAGIATSQTVQNAVARRMAVLDFTMADVRKFYVEARKAEPGLTFELFNERVGRAMITRSQDSLGQVNSVAGVYRKIFEDVRKDLEEIGVKTQDDYFHVVYRKDRVETEAFVTDLTEHFVRKGEEAEKAAELSLEIQDKLLHTPPGLNPDLVTSRGAFRSRMLNDVSDEFRLKYQDTNAQSVMRHYLRTTSGEIELTKAFGDPLMKRALSDVEVEYRALIDEAPNAEARHALEQEAATIISNIEKFRDDIRGLHNVPENASGFYHRALPVVRTLSYMAQSGFFLLSNMVDMTHAIGLYGMRTVLGEGWIKMIRDFEAWKLSAEEARMAGEALEAQRSLIVSEMHDVQHGVGSVSRFEKMIRKGGEATHKLNMMQWWADAMQRMNGVIAHSFILKRSRQLVDGTISARDRFWLAGLGIDERAARLIMDEADVFKVTDGGNVIANTLEWKNREAVSLFRNAIGKGGNLTRSLSGIGDRPFWASTNLGRTMTQYMSFAFASTTRILINRLQARDLAALNASIAAIALGAGVFATKQIIKKQALPTDLDEWTIEAVDHSGLTGWAFQGDQMLQRLTDGQLGLNRIYQGFEHRYYTPQDTLEAVLGPSGGYFGKLTSGMSGSMKSLMGDGTIDSASVQEIRQTIPWQNLFYLQFLFSRIGEYHDSRK